jgi:hypothetical protein
MIFIILRIAMKTGFPIKYHSLSIGHPFFRLWCFMISPEVEKEGIVHAVSKISGRRALQHGAEIVSLNP